ncbi:caspase family protein [Streptomyces broussonetiae]|uniref:Caspase family protein n=1 Tax=Streptomyces broussonetiae TaxID=2686304 RepID=A0ABV5E3P6_9ACTN
MTAHPKLDQTGSRAVLFGVHAYQHLPGLDGVRHNVPALRDLLVAPDVGVFAGEHCVAVPANGTPQLLLDAVQDAADHARDLLLVYYAGHGHFGRDSRGLLLGTEASRPDRPHHSVAYDEIRAIVAASRARHRVVVVDCCFSGAALHMDGQRDAAPTPKAPVFDIEGACVLTSAAETERSLCLPDGSVFTRELVHLLRDGLTGELSDGRRGEHLTVLTMADVYEVLRERLTGRTVEGHPVPLPRMSTRDSGHRIPLAANRAHTPQTPAAPTAAGPAAAPLSTAYAATRYFTGRTKELTELERTAVEQPAAVCVVHGRGGQGKTELLRALAARTTHLFPGGCLEIDLRGWTPGEQPRDPYMVIAEQLHHMGHAAEDVPKDLTARAETWRLFLKQNPVLLLLDNARDARQLAPLLPSAGSPSTVIISSRSELAEVNAHWRFELPPLTATDCVTVWHKMGIPQDTGQLDEIAGLINGSPLALGPIGTRLMHGASPTAVLASLTGPNRYATFPTIDTAERAAFTAAYATLDADLRNLIHHCAWHPGPDFGPDSLAAMADRPEHEVEVRLAEFEQLLIRKNGRYSLHDLSLSYARETAVHHTTEEEADAARQRLYEHLHNGLRDARDVLRTTRTSDDTEVRAARHWLDTHARELQAAARAADADSWPRSPDFLVDLGRSLYFDDRYIESWELLQTVLRTTSPDPSRHAEAIKGLGDIHRFQGRFDEAAAAYAEALANLRHPRRPPRPGRHLRQPRLPPPVPTPLRRGHRRLRQGPRRLRDGPLPHRPGHRPRRPRGHPPGPEPPRPRPHRLPHRPGPLHRGQPPLRRNPLPTGPRPAGRNREPRNDSVAGSAVETGDVELDALHGLEGREGLPPGGLSGLHVGLQLRAVRHPRTARVDRLPLPGVVGLLTAAVLDRPNDPDIGDPGLRAVIQPEAGEIGTLALGFLRLPPRRLGGGGTRGRGSGAFVVTPHRDHEHHDENHDHHGQRAEAPPKTPTASLFPARWPRGRRPLPGWGRRIARAPPPRSTRRRLVR